MSATLGNYVNDKPSDLGNFMSADTVNAPVRMAAHRDARQLRT